ncbi:MAG TPA: hypothetical protein VFS21_34300 [Roseiflexaceae bacterium]|nr:hypothetical protein [Roseiflexaceae bacterium]
MQPERSLQPQLLGDGAQRSAPLKAAATPSPTALWFGLRALTLLYATLFSAVAPLTARERALPLWPPGEPAAWLERTLLAPWERRDVEYYRAIVERGYRIDDGTAQFHPLLSWLASPLHWLGASPLLALLLVASVAALLLLLAFERLALLDLPPAQARLAVALLACAPPCFILFAPYPEGLFLLWATLCLLWARQRRWWLAGLAGALAALTRQQGVLLALPLAWELWDARAKRREARGVGLEARSPSASNDNSPRNTHHSTLTDWLSLGLPPMGLLVWLVYRGLALGDVRVSAVGPQELIYSLLISPSAAQVVPEQAFLWPWQALWLALSKFARAPEYSLAIDLVLGAGFVALLALGWPRMRGSYRVYALAVTLISFAYYTGPHYPYMGLPRHLLLATPVFIALAPLAAERPWLRRTLLDGGILVFSFLLLQFSIHGWVP